MIRQKRKGFFLKIFIPVIGIALFFLILFFIKEESLFSQNKGDNYAEQAQEEYTFPYDISNPSQKFKLPHRLDEISGLSYYKQNKLMCIQDEKGTMYVFDLEKGKVTEKYKFAEGNDYEDIEIVKKSAYILQSNGTLLQVEDFTTDTPKVKKYNTSLSRKNDAEGLAFDAESGALFIACKGSAHLTKKDKVLMKGKKAVYQFDLHTNKLLETPVYLIDNVYVKNAGVDSQGTNFFSKLFRGSDPRGSSAKFRPSGIAVHPKTKNIYIVSSSNNMLIVMNRKGDIIEAVILPQEIFKQPEGICFTPEGDLFISNEKKGKRANILQFDYRCSENNFAKMYSHKAGR